MAEEKKYYSIITDAGTAAIVLSIAEGKKVNLTKFAVGDGGGSYYQPTKDMLELKGETFRGNIKSYEIDSLSPNIAVVKAILPYSVGGWTIREMGVFDEDGVLIGIGNMPEMEKVAAESGASYEMELTMRIAVSNIEQLEFKFDPVTILLTKKDMDIHNMDVNAHELLFQQKAEEEAFTNHANDFSIHVNSQTMEQYSQGLTELEQHVNDSAIHVTQEKQDFWNAGAQTAEEAKGKSQEAMIKANENEQRILALETSLYSNVTQNPFSVAFDGLSGVQVIKGVWNQSKQRIEC